MSFDLTKPARTAYVVIVCAFGGIASTGCAQEPTPPKSTVPAEKLCTDPRPQMCMEIYQPVCGFTKDGAAHTYPNSCHACANPEVVRYTPGECRKD